MTMPVVSDGKAVIRQLEANGCDPRIPRIAKRALAAQSCVSDLAQCKDACDALRDLNSRPKQAPHDLHAATEAALMMSALLLYARATSTNGKLGERGSIDISNKLDEVQAKDHQAILDVRNKAMAHVYSGELLADHLWHRDELLLIENEEGWRVGAATQRTQVNYDTLAALQRQLPVAHHILNAIFQKRIGQFTAAINDASIPPRIIQAHAIDLSELMGSHGAAQAAIDGLAVGRASYCS